MKRRERPFDFITGEQSAIDGIGQKSTGGVNFMQRCVLGVMFLLAVGLPLGGQTRANNGALVATDSVGGSSLPVIVKLSGSMQEFGGTIPPGFRGMTFALYQDQTGGVPLWMETQTVSVDNQGRFTVLLGSTSTNGIPASAFASAEPRWVSLTLDDGADRPRVELSSVPYAFKASDADTLGGKNSGEFVSQQQLNSLLSILKWPTPIPWPPVSFPGISPTFEATAAVGPSFVSAATSGPPFQVKSEVLVPNLNADLLHGLSDSAFAKLIGNNSFLGSQNFAGGIDMPASSLEPNTPNSFDSAPLDFESSSPGPQPNTVMTQRFRWESQSLAPASNGPTAHLSLSFGADGANPSSTGLSINSDGSINFAPGQQLPTSAVLAAISAGAGNGGTGSGPAGGGSPFVNTSNYGWAQQPPLTAGIVVGPNIVTLTPCPRGVNGADAWHYLYVAGTGTPEVVLLTGGSCNSRAASGTIEFTANYVHPPGYSIGSATAGIQEAIIDADVIKTAGQISRQVIIDPGAHFLRARVSVRSSSMKITSSGATLTCAMSDTCLMLGDPTNGNSYQSIVLEGLRVAPGVVGGTWPAVEDNAQGSQVTDFGPAASSVPGASFGSLVQIDNDQAAVINRLSTTFNFAWGRCDTTFCSTAVVGPGPFSKNAGVLWIQNSDISLQCGGNGIDNQDGNTTQVSNSVIQGYAQFGIRASTVYRENTVFLSSVYEEEDGYCNPLGTGSSGLIVEGGHATTSASPSAGLLPLFANTGSTLFYYYIVVHSSTLGTSPTYIAGYAATNGSGPIKVLWNQVGTAGDITYDALRISGDGGADMAAPYGTGPFAIAVGVPASLCINHVCSAVDDAGSSPSSYTVADSTPYWPSLKLWPGTVILTSANDTVNSGGGNPTTYSTDQLLRGTIVNSAGATYPSVFAQECEAQGSWSSIWTQCLGGNSVGNDSPAVTGTVMQLSGTGGAPGGLKGRLIFELPPGAEVGPTHVITLSDSNPDKTLATPGNRPTWDPNDSYIGYDGGYFPSKMQVAFGAPVSISRYIGNTGDGIHYVERLTATQEQYHVPVSLVSVPFSSLPALPDGTVLYCSDCKNVHDDVAMFDSGAEGGGHGTNLLHENGQWRVH
jgi:hypothetical protein